MTTDLSVDDDREKCLEELKTRDKHLYDMIEHIRKNQTPEFNNFLTALLLFDYEIEATIIEEHELSLLHIEFVRKDTKEKGFGVLIDLKKELMIS